MKFGNLLPWLLVVVAGVVLGKLLLTIAGSTAQDRVSPLEAPQVSAQDPDGQTAALDPLLEPRTPAGQESADTGPPEQKPVDLRTEEQREKDDQRWKRFLHAQEKFLNAPLAHKDEYALGLVTESVVAIMRNRGLALDPTPEERIEGFSLKPEFEDELRFAAHEQLFVFHKGDYPAYEQVMARTRAWALGPEPGPFPEETVEAITALADEAFNCLTTTATGD